jgi:hypothetical protein
MNDSKILTLLRSWLRGIDWRLLIFLILVLDVKLAAKIIAVVAIYVLRPNFRFGFRSFRHPKIPHFYWILPVIALLDWLLRLNFSAASGLLLVSSLFFWAMCILIVYQMRLFAEQRDQVVVHRTVALFFLLNAAVSIGTLIDIMFITGTLNPYNYLGMGQAYFISTGDHIQGITFDFSLTNALINTMGIVYFIARRQYLPVIACVVALLLTGSNFTNLLLAFVLVILFFYRSPVVQKVTTAVCLVLLVFFMKVVSPENKDYAAATIATIAKHEQVNFTPVDTAFHVSAKQEAMIKKAEVIEEKHDFKLTPAQAKLPGKVISYQQTLEYLFGNPKRMLFGSGAGLFSSKLAFRASGLGTEGNYPARYVHIDPAFLDNHLSLFVFYFTKGNQHHSIINTPFSVYNQALGEYGIAGLAALLIFYFGFFIRRNTKGLHPWLLLGIVAFSFCTDYWFEQLSIVILFELLWFIQFRQETETTS